MNFVRGLFTEDLWPSPNTDPKRFPSPPALSPLTRGEGAFLRPPLGYFSSKWFFAFTFAHAEA